MSNSNLEPVSASEFAALMARLGPFESNPVIAVAVSGGVDSMTAALLTNEWACSLGGRAVGVIIDHGLRPESSDEAALVTRRLSALGMESAVLEWCGEKPRSNVQAAAREARYLLLSEYCAKEGILHLVLGHHQEDQAETFLIRLSRGSGLYGLAAMAAIQEQPDHRILRPLLTLPKLRLSETLKAQNVEWVEDPSNRNHKYTRTRVRNLLPALSAEGLPASRLAATTQRLGQARSGTEAAVTSALARAVSIHPTGILFLRPEVLWRLPHDVALRCLARLLTTVSGNDYGPRLERLESLYEKILEGLSAGVTLSGCRLMPWRQILVVCRENRQISRKPLVVGRLARWDGRFDIMLAENLESVARTLRIGALGSGGWAEIRKSVSPETLGFPPLAGDAVAALWDDEGVAAAPHLGYYKQKIYRDMIVKFRFRSGISLTGVAFTVA